MGDTEQQSTPVNGLTGWLKVVLGTILFLCVGGLIAWGSTLSTVDDHERRIAGTEKTTTEIAKTQNEDGRALSAVKADLDSIKTGIKDIKRALSRMAK
ncbi:MAG: hypothetical protein GY923_15270 [Aestuariibacter sp.]|nr:hypothetical protein [Aestuariibacter sp.]